MDAHRRRRHVRYGGGTLPPRWRFQLELPTVLTVAFVLLFLVSWDPLERVLPEQELYGLLGLAAAAAAASASIAAMIAARESDDRTMRMVATALVFYGMIVMPLSVTRTTATAPFWLHGALFGASVAFLGLMGAALHQRGGRWLTGWRGVLAGIVLTVLASAAAQRFQESVAMLVDSRVLSGLVLAGWCALSLMFVARGVFAGDAVTWRVGLGLGVIAIAHLLRAAGEGTVATIDIPFFTLRLFGLLVLLAALASYARRALVDQREKRSEEYQRLRFAALSAEQIAEQTAEQHRERDHEMRNVLAGISGAAHLLGSATPVGGFDLNAAVTEELNRLRAMLERPAGAEAARNTPVPELLTRLVMLRRAAGADIELSAPGALRVAMPPEELAQVVSNLLVNCARYAPDAQVRVRAWAEGGVGRIEVADSGPGIAVETGRHSAPSGSGIGLAVSSRMLADYGGLLRLLPARQGCTALIEVPLVTAPAVARTSHRGSLVPGVA